MKFRIITTGKGMMEAGEVIGEIEAESHEEALVALTKFLQGRPVIWELRESH